MLGVDLKRFQVDVVGSRSFADVGVKNGIVNVLLGHPKFVPEQWGYEERGGSKFDRDEVLGEIPTPGSILFFRRRRGIRQEILMSLGNRPRLKWDFTPPPSTDGWPEIFGIAAELADAYQPDFSFVRAKVDLELDQSDEASRTQYLMDSPGDCSPVWYRKEGVSGLGIRTIFGPLTADQVDRDRLHSLPKPATVRDLKWGGVLVDLMPDPWSRQMAELRTSWVACMKHLMPSDFFTKTTLQPNGAIKREVPAKPGWDPGGLVR